MKAEFGKLRSLKARQFGTLMVQTLTGGKSKPFSVHKIEMKAGAGHPAIYHAQTDELFLVLAGKAEAVIDGKSRTIRRGDFAYMPAGTVHKFKASRDGVTVLCVFEPGLELDRPDVRQWA